VETAVVEFSLYATLKSAPCRPSEVAIKTLYLGRIDRQTGGSQHCYNIAYVVLISRRQLWIVAYCILHVQAYEIERIVQ